MQTIPTKYACECGKSFLKQSLLTRHSRVHNKESPYICAECNRAFNQKASLKIHLIKHKNIRNYICDKCPSCFSQKAQLSLHIQRVHTIQTPNACQKCASYYKDVGSLNAHQRKYHDVDNIMNQLSLLKGSAPVEKIKKVEEKEATTDAGNFIDFFDKLENGKIISRKLKVETINSILWCVCEICSKKMKKPSDMIRHLRTHSREKPFSCHYCEKGFSQKSTLTKHLQSHSNQKYFCQICDQYFQNIELLSQHSLVHTNESFSFQCTKCFKVYDTYIQLRNHIQNHNRTKKKELVHQVREKKLVFLDDEERKFICKLCGSGFKEAKYLKQHESCHTSDNKFACTICAKSLSSKRSLIQHNLVHTSTKEHGCEQCGKQFATRAKVQRHVNARHNKDESVHQQIDGQETQQNVSLSAFQVQIGDGTINEGQVMITYAIPISQVFPNLTLPTNEVDSIVLESTSEVIADDFQLLSYASVDENEFGDFLTFRNNEIPSQILGETNEVSKVDNAETSNPSQKFGKGKSCSFCGKLFKKPIDLRRHETTHTKSRLFPCGVCEKRFALKCTRDRHTHTHNVHNAENRPAAVCNICSKSFKSATSRNLHLRLHYDILPFCCNFCYLKFRTSGHLKAHQKSHFKLSASNHTRTRKTAKITKIIDNFDPQLVLEGGFEYVPS